MPPPAVLVVEDEFWVMLDISESLAESGFEVVCARNGDEAVTVLEARDDIRAVFTDINMPGSLDGLALARTVHSRWPAIRVLVTSGRDRADDLDLPATDAFIPKPYHPKVVISRLGRMLGSGGQRPASAWG